MQSEEKVLVEAKPFWKSWTILFNTLAALLVLAEWAVTQEFSFVREEWFATLVTVGNIILRIVKTNRPVATSSGKTVLLDKAA